MSATKTCPYCAEEIRAEAVLCRYCGSHLGASRLDRLRFDPGAWRRDHDDRLLGGVGSAIAHATGLPLTLVRIGFVVLTLVSLAGPLLYGLLFLALPAERGVPSPLETLLARALELLRRMKGQSSADAAGSPVTTASESGAHGESTRGL